MEALRTKISLIVSSSISSQKIEQRMITGNDVFVGETILQNRCFRCHLSVFMLGVLPVKRTFKHNMLCVVLKYERSTVPAYSYVSLQTKSIHIHLCYLALCIMRHLCFTMHASVVHLRQA